jgi:hypothetical protein
MINYKEVEQKSLEWHELKWGKIGGTLSAGLLVKSDTLLIDILSQRLEEFEPTDSWESADMARGNELEPFAVEYLETYLGVKFERTGWLQCEDNELLGISPDGITEDETQACEIKCFARKKHTEILLNDSIPLDNLNQLVHYFTVNPKLEKLHFFCYRPESVKHFHKELTRETIVNLGTKAKPIEKTISEWVKELRKKADVLLKEIKEKEESINF